MINSNHRDSRSPIIEVLSNNKPTTTPIWLMRQAGRYLPEYKKISEAEKGFLKMCYNPNIATEITLQPIKRFKYLDAAIVFSDILVIADALGCDVNFVKDSGPVIEFDHKKGLLNPEEIQNKISPITETIKNVKKELPDDKCLIGFAGSPWTVLSYILEGHGSKNYSNALKICYNDYSYAISLIRIITDATIIFLLKQLESGADVLQLFDSNAGLLTYKMYKSFVIEPTKYIVEAIKSYKKNVKIVGFPRCSGMMYKEYSENTNVDAVSVDQYIDLSWAKKNIKKVIQGNFDPYLLAYRKEKIDSEASGIVSAMNNTPFIFNLGHGVIKDTPVDNVEKLIECVKGKF